MDSFLVEMDMWVSTPRDCYDLGFYVRVKRSNEIYSLITELKKLQSEFFIHQARLENNWTSYNFEQYGIANWNLKLAKSELDMLVNDTWEQIDAWQSLSY
jgi:hypothetical protein